MDRRTLLAGTGAVLLAAPRAAEAQQAGKVYRIGFLSGSSALASRPYIEQFRLGLRELGYVEGRSIIIEYRWAEGQQDRLPQVATDLVQIAPDLPFSRALNPAYSVAARVPRGVSALGAPRGP